jgi:hypothetical protein|tara:strand:+ start:16261 stop:17976 length:1716 start_codon:yes stop_codon:yes gene_type:complete
MSAKTPIRTVFDNSNNATGLAEFQSGEFVALSHGGLGASLSIGSAGQVLKVNSGASALEFGTVEAVFNIDGMTDGTSITVADSDQIAISDGGTEKRINASQLKTYVNTSFGITSLDIDGASDIGAALTTSDLIIVDDGAGGTNRKSALSRLVTLMESEIDSIGGNLSITGNLTVNGTTTTVNSTTTTVDDPIFTLGGDTAPGSDDNKDRGIEFRYHTGSAAKIGFFGFDDSTGKFTFIPDASNSSEVFSGTAGTIVASTFEGDLTGDVTGTIQTAAQTNITSLGTLSTLTVDDITINASTISDGGDFTLDVGGDINIDAGGGDIVLKDDGTQFGGLTNTSGNLIIKSGSTTAATFSGANTTLAGTVASGAITSSGIIKTDDTTEATSTTDGSLQTDGGLSVAKDVVAGDDVKLLSDAAVLSFGADSDVSITHVADTGILINSSREIQFNDSQESIKSDGSKLILKSNNVSFSLPTADGTDGQVIKTDGSGALSFGDAASSGFVNSTITTTPGSVDFDLTKANNTGSSETPFQDLSDAFTTVIRHVYDLVEPKGASTSNNVDLGSSESHLGA